jgi:hypothetical protein
MTFTQFCSEKNNFAYVCSATDAADKQRRLGELRKRFEQSDFSSDGTTAAFGQPERTETAFNDLRRLTVRHSVRDSIKAYVLSRNESIRKQKDKQKEKEKAEQNPLVSKPFWF